MKILLIGRNGQVGRQLSRTLAPLGDLTAMGRTELDLRDAGQVAEMVHGLRPDVIVNAAAYTAVDKAESEREIAFSVNAVAVGELARHAVRLGALLVHYSTDYVFDGEKPEPYVEDDLPNPINAYGASKLAGELAITTSGCRHLILRTSWVFGPHGSNFVLTMLRAARERPELRVVDDQVGAPTSSPAIARATAQILGGRPEGVYHMSAAGRTSWCAFAREILRRAGLSTPVVPIRSEEFAAAARRPRNSLLDNRRLRETFGIALVPWQEQLAEVMAAHER